jgi:hypothetical protein
MVEANEGADQLSTITESAIAETIFFKLAPGISSTLQRP